MNSSNPITAPIFLGIPILNRLDLLARCLRSIDYPAEAVVVNNNAVDTVFRRELEALAAAGLPGGGAVTVLHQARNLGVAASWNLILRTGLARGREWVFVGSNDTSLHPGSLRAAVEMPKEERVRVWHLCAWNFFLLHASAVRDVGWFDENFYPAYKEDQDYSYRCLLAGVGRVDVPGAGGEHVGSATIRSNRAYARRNRDTHGNWNQNHYLMKWGGDAGAERFTTPYGRPDKDHRWWPDPGGSIAARDWDAPPANPGQE